MPSISHFMMPKKGGAVTAGQPLGKNKNTSTSTFPTHIMNSEKIVGCILGMFSDYDNAVPY